MEKDTITAINDSPFMFVANITGGGTSFVPEWLTIPGGSNTILNHSTPYFFDAVDRIVGYKPDRYSSEEVAKGLSLAAYEEACSYDIGEDKEPVGIGVSCSIASHNERVGRKHRFYIHIHRKFKTTKLSLVLSQGLLRQEEEALCKNLILSNLAKNCETTRGRTCVQTINNLKNVIDYKIQDFKSQEKDFSPEVFKTLLASRNPQDYYAEENVFLFPGSFNPRTSAHKEISFRVSEKYGCIPLHEICLGNIEKPTIDCEDINNRRSYFSNDSVIFTDHSLARFVEKYKFFKQTFKKVNFIMGYDTYERLIQDPDIISLIKSMEVDEEVMAVLGISDELTPPPLGTEVFDFLEYESEVRASKIRSGELQETI